MNPDPAPSNRTEELDPTAGSARAPEWLLVLVPVLAFWGMAFLDKHGGGFNPQVYGPYQTLEEVEKDQPRSAGDDMFRNGKVIYDTYCAVCHLPTGQGNPSTFIPPLAGSEWVLAKEPGRIIRIVSKGLTGPIEVDGKQFGGGQMFAVGDSMPVDEQQKAANIAAVLTYVRKAFGNNAPAVTVEQVAAVRKKIADRNAPMVVDELLKIPENE